MATPQRQARGGKIISTKFYDVDGRETDASGAVNGSAMVEGTDGVPETMHYERGDTVRKMYRKISGPLSTAELNKRFDESA